MRILIMGGTRFIGVYLTQQLVSLGHEVVLFNRGNNPLPIAGVGHIRGDRKDISSLKVALCKESFDVIFDNNGRELGDTQPLVEIFAGRIQQFVYMSSAGVYLKTDQLPNRETDALDPKSRHKGKADTEAYLKAQKVPFTAIRPTYIYGPQNYNDVEAWFFDRIVRGRPIPMPGDGQRITQLGHVKDLAAAMVATMGNDKAIGQIYNVSGDRFVTFDGLAQACAEAVGKSASELEIVHYDPNAFDFGKRKAFPLRVQHFFADIHKAAQDLNWSPKYDLVSGLQDSFQNDFLAHGRDQSDIDFSLDDQILASIT